MKKELSLNQSAGNLSLPTQNVGLTNSQMSWFGSIFLLSMAIGSIIAGYLVDIVGRKIVLIIGMSFT